MRTSVSVALIAASLVGCKAPPEAPAELSDLAGFVFERFVDEETADLAAGLENLELWLADNLDREDDESGSVREGYTVNELDPALIAAVRPNRQPEVDEAVAGSSVATTSAFGVPPVAQALTLDEQEAVFPDSYNSHERTVLEGGDCFLTQACDFLDTDNVVEASYAGGLLTVDTNSRSQYRWVEYGDEGKLALLNRTWLVEEANTGGVAGVLVELKEQIYSGVILPWEDGGSVRLGTIWVAIRLVGDLNEGYALSQMVNSMKKDGETLEEYLQDQ